MNKAMEQQLRDALKWCSGADDFQVGGKARVGWETLCIPLLKAHPEKTDLAKDLIAMLNGQNREEDSNTPDFILAEYMVACLDAFEVASNRREVWYGVEHKPEERELVTEDKLTASEAVFGFVGWLTTQYTVIKMGSGEDCVPVCDAVKMFCEWNKLPDPRDGWENNLIHPTGVGTN